MQVIRDFLLFGSYCLFTFLSWRAVFVSCGFCKRSFRRWLFLQEPCKLVARREVLFFGPSGRDPWPEVSISPQNLSLPPPHRTLSISSVLSRQPTADPLSLNHEPQCFGNQLRKTRGRLVLDMINYIYINHFVNFYFHQLYLNQLTI